MRVERLIAARAEMARERQQIAGILAQLPTNLGKVRETRNNLCDIVH